MNVKSKVTLVLVGLVMGMVCVFTVAAQEKPADNMQIVLEKIRAAASATTTTVQAEIYAFFFAQKGLMGGLGLAGTKITRIDK